MAKEINILYISLSGNTRDFVRRLTDYYQDLGVVVNSINVREKPDRQKLTAPFVTILPAFLNYGAATTTSPGSANCYWNGPRPLRRNKHDGRTNGSTILFLLQQSS